MSAERLREAARLMRSRAEAATPGLWRCDPEHERPSRPADCYDVIDDSTLPVVGSVPHADAEHIASWHPAVALAVADWLDECADVKSNPDVNAALKVALTDRAIKIADAYLGSASWSS